MKKLFIIFLLFIGSSLKAAPIIIDGLVTNGGVPVAQGTLLHINYSPNTDTIAFTTGAGRYITTINPRLLKGTVSIWFLDCRNDTIKETQSFDTLTSRLTINLNGCHIRNSIEFKGQIQNLPSPNTPLYVKYRFSTLNPYDSILVDTNGFYKSTLNSDSAGMINAFISDCKGNHLKDSAFYRSGDTVVMNFNYCQPPPPATYSGSISFQGRNISPNQAHLLRYKYNADKLNMEFVDTLEISPAGGFSFPKNSNDDYLLKAIPRDSLTQFVSTYYPNALWWNDGKAMAIGNHIPDTVALNINLISKRLNSPGNGKINGSVKVDKVLKIAGYNGTGILLLDDQYNAVDFVLSDANYNFSFVNLSAGTYYVWLDQCGVPTEPIEVTLSSNNSIISELVITANSLGIGSENFVGFESREGSSEELEVYPNPFSNHIDISNIEGNINVTNVVGHHYYSAIIEGSNINSTTINTNNWPKGIYILNVSSKNKTYSKTLLKQ